MGREDSQCPTVIYFLCWGSCRDGSGDFADLLCTTQKLDVKRLETLFQIPWGELTVQHHDVIGMDANLRVAVLQETEHTGPGLSLQCLPRGLDIPLLSFCARRA